MTRGHARLVILAAALLLFVALATSIWIYRNGHLGGCRDLGPAAAFPDNSVSSGSCAPVYVVHGSGPTFSVFLAQSPHLPGEGLDWDERSRLFVSPFHGEEFGLDGKVVQGPAMHGLWLCPFHDSFGHLVIDVPQDADASQIEMACERDYVP